MLVRVIKGEWLGPEMYMNFPVSSQADAWLFPVWVGGIHATTYTSVHWTYCKQACQDLHDRCWRHQFSTATHQRSCSLLALIIITHQTCHTISQILCLVPKVEIESNTRSWRHQRRMESLIECRGCHTSGLFNPVVRA